MHDHSHGVVLVLIGVGALVSCIRLGQVCSRSPGPQEHRAAVSGWSRRTRGAVVVILVLATLTTGVAANAYWSGTGTSTGAADTGTSQDVQLSPASPTADLYPGGTTGVVLTLTNPNPRGVRVASLGLDTTRGTDGFGVDAAHSGCAPLSALSLATTTNAGAGWDVPARVGTVDGDLAVTLPGALAMSTGAADACQGATFTVYLSSVS